MYRNFGLANASTEQKYKLYGDLDRMCRIAFYLSFAFMLNPTNAFSQTRLEQCGDWSDYAYIIMKNRQNGVPLRVAYEADIKTHNSIGSPTEHRNLTQLMIERAYQLPLERTERMAEVAAIQFSELNFALCMQN